MAGVNKKRGIIKSLHSAGANTTIVSPILVNNNNFNYHAKKDIFDEDLESILRIPATVDIYALNYLFLFISSIITTIKLTYKNDYDAIIFYDFQLETALPAFLGSILCQGSLILEYEDGLFYSDNFIIKSSAIILRRLIGPFVDGAVCVNQPLSNLIPTNNTTIVRGFPSIGMPDELPEPTYNQEATIVMFAGKFDRVRGIDMFLDVASNVDIKQKNTIFWISGYGADSELNRIKTRVEKLADNRFVYFGTLPWDEYRRRVVSADILVNFQDPSHNISKYTFPSKLLDFMSAGSIVVSTDMSDLRNRFSDKLVISEKSGEELSKVLTSVIIGEEDFQQKRCQSQKWVKEECSYTTVGNKILGLIN